MRHAGEGGTTQREEGFKYDHAVQQLTAMPLTLPPMILCIHKKRHTEEPSVRRWLDRGSESSPPC